MTATDSIQAPSASARADDILALAPHRIGKVTLVVRDLARVSRFYQDVIGLAPVREDGNVAELGVGRTVLLELRRDETARVRSPRDAGLFHTAFLLPTREDLGAWVRSVAENRIPVQGASDHLVSEAIYLADPEGNGIEVYADRPPSAWPYRDGALQMSTDPLDVPGLVQAAGKRAWEGFPAGGIVGHMHLQVGALTPADVFYGDLLGFDITCRYPGASFFGSGGYHHQLAANIWNSRGAPRRTDATTGLAGFEVLARDSSVIDATRERLARSGTEFEDRGDSLAVADPWGTQVILRPRA